MSSAPCAGVLCAGFVLGAGAVDARPTAVLDQAVLERAASTTAPGGQALGLRATVSGDGRFVAYEALPGGGDPAIAATDSRTSTVYLTDRETETTVEVTVVPLGLRPGNSIHPVLSGDGCSIVVVTELALDVFRDDDTGLRWDVYRQRLEHCGGTPGDWELVSSQGDGSAIARDDVDISDPPAVARAGNTIAYTHPATDLLEGDDITTVSLVDLTQPIGSPDRSRPVAGMPIISPDTEYVHAGIDQPAISGDGRFVAYRSDAASTDAVPGWGYGPVAGGPATPQIFVWDRAQADPFEAVKLVSERVDGLPTMTGASEPVLSRDGRVVAFTSSDVGLVPAVFPPCADGCPSQVYHLDRDVDANGRYDEPDRTEMTLVSSEPGTEPIVAGTAPSSQPSLSADGQLVAFITKATNLQLVKASGGGEADRRRPARRRRCTQHAASGDDDRRRRPAGRGCPLRSAAQRHRPHGRVRHAGRGATRSREPSGPPGRHHGEPADAVARRGRPRHHIGRLHERRMVRRRQQRRADDVHPVDGVGVRCTLPGQRGTEQLCTRCAGAARRRLHGPPHLHARRARTGHRNADRRRERLPGGVGVHHGSWRRRRPDAAHQSRRPGARLGRRRPAGPRVPVRRREHLVGADVGGVGPCRRPAPLGLRDLARTAARGVR